MKNKNYTRFLSRVGITLTVMAMLVSCARLPQMYSAAGQPLLTRQIKLAIDRSHLNTNLGIEVRSLSTGKVVYQLNPEHLYMPASNNKLYSAAAAFHYLGADFRFQTSLYYDTTGNKSNLILKAGGDPDFSLGTLDSLAEIAAGHISRIDTLIIDRTIIDSIHSGHGWMWDEGHWWYAAQIDPLSLNDNCVDIDFAPGHPGTPPQIITRPTTNYVELINQAVTVTDTIDFVEMEIERNWWENGNRITISGEIMYDDERDTVYRNIHDPARFTATVFQEMLTDNGLPVTGPITFRQLPSGAQLLAEHQSAPLSVIANNFLKESDNLSGELLLKTIGAVTAGEPGTWPKGLTAQKTYLCDVVGLDTTTLRIVDGSGVSRYNLTSPAQLVHLLAHVAENEDFYPAFRQALPIAGVDGTLEKRMGKTPADNKVFAKTGTLSGASTLSGYIESRRDTLVFAIMINGYVGSSNQYRRLQDEICNILVEY